MRFKLAIAGMLVLGATAHAAPVYSTSVQVAYDPNAPSYTGGNFAAASNNSTYTVRTGEDASNFYVDVTSTPIPGVTNPSLQFSNIYLGGNTLSPGLIIEVTNNRISTTSNPSNYYSLAGTGFTPSVATNDISFSIPFSFLETDPLGIGFTTVKPGDFVRVSYSQSFGYSLVYGGYLDPVNRLGLQYVPTTTTAVPEPLSFTLMWSGLVALGALRRRRV